MLELAGKTGEHVQHMQEDGTRDTEIQNTTAGLDLGLAAAAVSASSSLASAASPSNGKGGI
jgi:hypothetical protein